MKPLVYYCLVLMIGCFVLSDQAFAMGKKGGSAGHHRQLAGSNLDESEFNADLLYSFPRSISATEESPFKEELILSNPKLNYQGTNYNLYSKSQKWNYSHAIANEEWNEIEETNEVDNFPSATTVPEPATVALMGMGMVGLLFRRNNK